MRVLKIHITCILFLLGGLIFPNNVFAQQKKSSKKIVIVKKTVDENGNETVEKIIKEGDDAADFDVAEYLEKEDSGNVEINVEVQTEGLEKKKELEKEIEVVVKNETVIINGDGEKVILKIDDTDRQEITTEDGKHIIILKKEGDDVDVNELLEGMDIEIEEDGNEGKKEIRIMKMKKGNGAFFGVMIDPTAEGMELLDVVKGSPAEEIGMKKGDVFEAINGKKIHSYEQLTNILSKYHSGETIEVTYKSNGESKTKKVELADSKDMPMQEKMIWKTDGGEEIELHEDHEIHSEGEGKKKKIIKKKIIIKEDKAN